MAIGSGEELQCAVAECETNRQQMIPLLVFIVPIHVRDLEHYNQYPILSWPTSLYSAYFCWTPFEEKIAL